ncbi:hypothetical protein F4804DRAFT_332821 [Jackrogersella minutella]|nr:hypothetical protein F4804DRAFT_332821 [Jackrogersella minutella]
MAPYTHQESTLECVPVNTAFAFGTLGKPEENLPLFEDRRHKTMVGPRTAELHPRYDDNGRPVDFHFLENYHYRTLEHPDDAPLENDIISWPNIVVRLEEVYHVMVKISRNNQAGAKDFFGFFARPYVSLQEYWILIDEKEISQPECFKGPENIDLAYENEDPEFRDLLKLREEQIARDAMEKTPEDLIAVDDVDILNTCDMYRLQKVAECLRSWGTDVPVEPRIVRWAVNDEEPHRQPPTIFEVANKLRGIQPYGSTGLRTFPDICFR